LEEESSSSDEEIKDSKSKNAAKLSKQCTDDFDMIALDDQNDEFIDAKRERSNTISPAIMEIRDGYNSRKQFLIF